jgi:hypothetical protein
VLVENRDMTCTGVGLEGKAMTQSSRVKEEQLRRTSLEDEHGGGVVVCSSMYRK